MPAVHNSVIACQSINYPLIQILKPCSDLFQKCFTWKMETVSTSEQHSFKLFQIADSSIVAQPFDLIWELRSLTYFLFEQLGILGLT